MVRYYYTKYNAINNPTYATVNARRSYVTQKVYIHDGPWLVTTNGIINANGFFISTDSMPASQLWNKKDQYPYVLAPYEPQYAVTTGTMKTDGSYYWFETTSFLEVVKTDNYTRGTLVQSNIAAEDGTYPVNGRHTDGYWYVRGSAIPTNAAPSLTLATTDNRTLYENDQFNVTGQVTDADVGNVVTTKYSINGGTERAITATISQGTALTYNKVLTFKQGKLFDGANAITDTLADGSQHVLRVWAEDDKGGKSAEQVRVFYVVANRSAVLTINPVTSVSDLIDSDTIAISGNVSDPDGNTVTVRYKIGNGLYTQVYSGTGGAFNFSVSLADLQTGVNTVTIQATDSYGLSTTKTLRVTKSANNKPLLKSVATYKLTPPNGSADGIVLWVQRETGDLIVNAEISMGANGAIENFVPMVKDSTAYVTDAIEEDEFTFDNSEVSAENIVVRLTMERASATSDKGIKLISGVLS